MLFVALAIQTRLALSSASFDPPNWARTQLLLLLVSAQHHNACNLHALAYEEHVVNSQLFSQPASDLLAISCSVQARKHRHLWQGNVLTALPYTFLRLLKTDTSTSHIWMFWKLVWWLAVDLVSCMALAIGHWLYLTFGLLEGSACIFHDCIAPPAKHSARKPPAGPILRCFHQTAIQVSPFPSPKLLVQLQPWHSFP